MVKHLLEFLNVTLSDYENGELEIKSPEDIMNQFKRKIELIESNITVREFESTQNALIRVVYENNEAAFPHEDLDLKNKLVLFDKYTSKLISY